MAGSIMESKSLAVESWSEMPKLKKKQEKSRNGLVSNIKALPSPHTPFDLMQALFQKTEKEIHP
jgi:hypothetical protein